MENILSGHCALGRGADAQFPRGPWHCVWSHLPYKVKGLFVRCFREGHSEPSRRPGLDEWIEVLETYQYQMTVLGYHSREILPAKPKSQERKGNPAYIS